MDQKRYSTCNYRTLLEKGNMNNCGPPLGFLLTHSPMCTIKMKYPALGASGTSGQSWWFIFFKGLNCTVSSDLFSDAQQDVDVSPKKNSGGNVSRPQSSISHLPGVEVPPERLGSKKHISGGKDLIL